MKKTIMISAVFLILSSCNNPSTKNEGTNNESADYEKSKQNTAEQIFNLDTSALKSGQTFYQCPMDLEVISDKSGTCPKCKMDLEIKTKQ